jgi:hypothetical protein
MVKGETMIIFNEVFDANTGIAFYSIEKNKWAVVSYDEYTGLNALDGKKKKELYRGDTINVRSFFAKKIYCKFENKEIIKYQGAFGFWDKCNFIPLCNIDSFKNHSII